MRLRTHDVRWGFLGAGRIARVFAADLAAAGLRVLAVAARDAARAERFARSLLVPLDGSQAVMRLLDGLRGRRLSPAAAPLAGRR